MSDETIITVDGAEELERRLSALTNPNRNRLIVNSITRGAEIIRSEAARNAPKRTGQLSRSLRIIEVTPRQGIAAHVVIETRSEFFKGDEWYGGLQEFGWRVGKRKQRNARRLSWSKSRQVVEIAGDRRKKIPGKRFIRRAFRSRGQAAADLSAKLIWEGIEAQVTRG
jgi:hypothetical protein